VEVEIGSGIGVVMVLAGGWLEVGADWGSG